MRTVTAVIPTVGRSSLRDAVQSVVDQQECAAQALVVLDDPDRRDEVTELLTGLDHRLMTVDRLGASGARNAGLRAASGDYIGYLDDDDRWLAQKSIRQIRAIESSPRPDRAFAVAASRFIRRDGTDGSSQVRPFDADDILANYLVRRQYLRYGSVYFNTPALLAPASLLKNVEWDETLVKHEDWDVMIRLMALDGVECCIVDETLLEVQQGSPGSLSELSDWRHGAAWLDKHDAAVTGRDRADFVLVHVLLHALRQRSVEGVRYSLRHLSAPPHRGAAARLAAGTLLRR